MGWHRSNAVFLTFQWISTERFSKIVSIKWNTRYLIFFFFMFYLTVFIIRISINLHFQFLAFWMISTALVQKNTNQQNKIFWGHVWKPLVLLKSISPSRIWTSSKYNIVYNFYNVSTCIKQRKRLGFKKPQFYLKYWV